MRSFVDDIRGVTAGYPTLSIKEVIFVMEPLKQPGIQL